MRFQSSFSSLLAAHRAGGGVRGDLATVPNVYFSPPKTCRASLVCDEGRCFARFWSRASASPRAARTAEIPLYRACTSGACGRPGAGASSYWRHGPVRIGGRGSLLSRRNGALPYSTGDFKWVVNCLLVCFTDAKTWSRSADTRTVEGAGLAHPRSIPHQSITLGFVGELENEADYLSLSTLRRRGRFRNNATARSTSTP